MQSKEILLEETILNIVKEQVGDLDIDEAIYLHNAYQEDNHTTVCANCEAKVSEESLAYQFNNGYDDENHCPNCNIVMSAHDLVKPEFSLWLELND